jgi:WD40 repeat protein
MDTKQRNTIVAIITIVLILTVMFFAQRQSHLVRQLQGPIEGTDSVVTVDNRLSVVSKNNHVYTWQWNDLSIWPVVARLQAQAVMPIASEKIVYIPSADFSGLIMTDLKGQKEIARLQQSYGVECKKIKTSQNDKFGVVSMFFKEGMQKGWFKLAVFDSELKGLSFVFQKDTDAEDFLLCDFTITNDGNLLAGAGEKGQAWIFVTDVNNGNVLWDRTFDEYGRFTSVEFSPDDKTLFAAEKTRHILVFDTATGQLLNKFAMDEYQTVAHLKQNISCIAISPDGNILAADTEPAGAIWLWDITSGRQIGTLPVGSGLIVSGIAFSPDSQYLATSCMVSPEIRVWKVPKTANVSK